MALAEVQLVEAVDGFKRHALAVGLKIIEPLRGAEHIEHVGRGLHLPQHIRLRGLVAMRQGRAAGCIEQFRHQFRNHSDEIGCCLLHINLPMQVRKQSEKDLSDDIIPEQAAQGLCIFATIRRERSPIFARMGQSHVAPWQSRG